MSFIVDPLGKKKFFGLNTLGLGLECSLTGYVRVAFNVFEIKFDKLPCLPPPR